METQLLHSPPCCPLGLVVQSSWDSLEAWAGRQCVCLEWQPHHILFISSKLEWDGGFHWSRRIVMLTCTWLDMCMAGNAPLRYSFIVVWLLHPEYQMREPSCGGGGGGICICTYVGEFDVEFVTVRHVFPQNYVRTKVMWCYCNSSFEMSCHDCTSHWHTYNITGVGVERRESHIRVRAWELSFLL